MFCVILSAGNLDHVETQPVDIMTVPLPDKSPLASGSPMVPTEKLRLQYQKVGQDDQSKTVRLGEGSEAKAPGNETADPAADAAKERSKAAEIESVVRRSDQLSQRKTKKDGRKQKKNGKVKKGRKGKKAKKTKKGRKPSSKSAVSPSKRKRNILRSQPAASSGPDAAAAKAERQKPGKARKVKEDGTSGKRRAPKRAVAPEEEVAPLPKQKAAPRAKGKAKAKAKAKASARRTALEPDHRPDLSDPEMVQVFVDFAKKVGGPKVEVNQGFKDHVRSECQKLKTTELNVYWSRCTCGVTLLQDKRDTHHFGFNYSMAVGTYKIAVAVKCAEMLPSCCSIRIALQPRLCLVALLKAAKRFLATFALKCSSWTPVNQGTSNRAPCASIGHEEYRSVQEANKLGSRFLDLILYDLIIRPFQICKAFPHTTAARLHKRTQDYIFGNGDTGLGRLLAP